MSLAVVSRLRHCTILAALALTACAQRPIEIHIGSASQSFRASHLIAADEPAAARTAERIFEAGGSAADAAAALGLTLAVTLPSSAGLGGGGACLVHDGISGATRALRFLPPGAAGPATPMLLAGMRSLHAAYGRLPWPQIVAPAEGLARFGHPLAQALAKDLGDGTLLMSDSAALTTFMNARHQILRVGETFVQLALAETLARVRRGVAPSTLESVPVWEDASASDANGARRFSLSHAREGRAGSTGFLVGDTNGTVIACVLTMGRLFGTGANVSDQGFLQADATAVSATPLAAEMMLDRAGAHVIAARASGAFSNTMDCKADDALGTLSCIAAVDDHGAGVARTLP